MLANFVCGGYTVFTLKILDLDPSIALVSPIARYFYNPRKLYLWKVYCFHIENIEP